MNNITTAQWNALLDNTLFPGSAKIERISMAVLNGMPEETRIKALKLWAIGELEIKD